MVAGPGAGKTATIVERMQRILEEDSNRVVSLFTFTRTSRLDTENKLKSALGKTTVEQAPSSVPRVSTLHTFAKRLVHRFADAVGLTPDFIVLNERMGETALILAEVIEDLGIAVSTETLETGLSSFRANAEWPDDSKLSTSESTAVISKFEELAAFYDAVDMAGLVSKACIILSNNAQALPPVHLQVDEYQDLNPADQELVHLASSNPSSEVVVVGDDTQSIYGFRDANPEGIRTLWQSKEWTQMALTVSHRLPRHILLAAHTLVADRDYLGAPSNLPPGDGALITVLRCTTAQLQAKAIAAQIRRMREDSQNALGGALCLKDFMVLCPTANQVSNVSTSLTEMGIPVRTAKKETMPDSVWRFVLLMRMLSGRDNLALRQWLDLIDIAPTDVQEMRRKAQGKDVALFEWCEQYGGIVVTDFLKALERLRAAQLVTAEFQTALRATPGLILDEALSKVVDDSLPYLPFSGRIVTHINEAYGLLERDEPGLDSADEEDRVLVSTMYASKGLEAEIVFIPWMNASVMPVPGRDELEEERVFYVALTRAKRDVILVFFESYDSSNHRRLRNEAMSPFLQKIQDHLHIKSIKAADLKKQ